MSDDTKPHWYHDWRKVAALVVAVITAVASALGVAPDVPAPEPLVCDCGDDTDT